MEYLDYTFKIILFVFGIFISIIAYLYKSKQKEIANDILEVRNKISSIESDERLGRKEIWIELNALKERMVKIETLIDKED